MQAALTAMTAINIFALLFGIGGWMAHKPRFSLSASRPLTLTAALLPGARIGVFIDRVAHRFYFARKATFNQRQVS